MLAPAGSHSRASLARSLGVSRAWVTQALAVLTVPTFLRDSLRQAAADGRPVGEGVWRRIKGLDLPDALWHLQEWGYLPEEWEQREQRGTSPALDVPEREQR